MTTLLVLTLLAADWTHVKTDGDVTLEKRDVPGSQYPELRLQARSRSSPEALAAAIWLKRDGKYERMKKLTRTLSESATERVRYEQIATPVVSNRDYTVRQRLLVDRTTNVFQMIYEAEPASAQPPQSGVVRIEKMSGTWTFEPAEGGGSNVTYICHSDPAGDIPAFMAKGAQIDAARVVWAEVDADAAAHPEPRLAGIR